MKKFTIWFVAVLLFTSSSVGGQTTHEPTETGLQKVKLNLFTSSSVGGQTTHEPTETGLQKVKLNRQSEIAPGTVPGPIQYSDDPFDLQFEYLCADASGEAGIETDGSYLYTTKWNGDLFFRYEMDGTYVESFQVPGTASVRDLAYDGTYFYGAAASTILFEMDFDSETLISTISAAVATRAIAYDDGEDGFWANNWSDTPTLYDRSGAVLGSFNIGGDESFYGFAWMDNELGIGLWAYSQKVGTSQNMLFLYDVDSGSLIDEFDMLSILSMPVTGDIAGGLFFSHDAIPGSTTLGGLVQNVCIWGIEMGAGHIPVIEVDPLEVFEALGPDQTSTQYLTIGSMGCANVIYDIEVNFLTAPNKAALDEWLIVSPLNGIIPPGDFDMIALDFNSTGLPPGNYNAELIITSNDQNNPEIMVPVTLTVEDAGILEPPTNFVASYVPPNSAELSWDAPIQPEDNRIEQKPVNNNSNDLGGDNLKPTKNLSSNFNGRLELEGYNIYRDGVLIAEIGLETNYLDTNLTNGTYSFEVAARYDEGLSQQADPVQVIVPLGPVISVDPTSVSQSVVFGGTAQSFLDIINNGDEDLTFGISISYFNDNVGTDKQIIPKVYTAAQATHQNKRGNTSMPEDAPGFEPEAIQYSDNPYDLQFEYPCIDPSGQTGIETDGNYIYTTTWNSNQITRYEMNGTFVGNFECASGVRDLAWDGTYFYGAAANTTIFEMDFDAQLIVSTFTAPVETRAIAYDERYDGFWANNWSDPSTLYDRSGATLGSFFLGGGEGFYGFAYIDAYLGEYLWCYSQSGSGNMIVQYELPYGDFVSEYDMMNILTMPVAGDVAGGLFSHPDITPGVWTLGGLVQNVCIWGIEIDCYEHDANDVGVYSIIEPHTGYGLTATEPVTISIKNYGYNTQSDIPYDVSWNDGYYESVFPGPLAPSETVEITLPVTADVSTYYFSYTFEACTYLDGDENPENDCRTKNVSNYTPIYCWASTTVEDEWIANVLCGDINNASGWQGNVADYTDLSTVIDVGSSEEITIENGNSYAADIVHVWVDWNDNFEFATGNEEFHLININGQGQTFTGTITVPLNTTDGEHRMRVRMTYSTPPVPCYDSNYGEVEDYTIVTHDSGIAWLAAAPLSGTVAPGSTETITLDFDAAGLEIGSYTAELNIANNSASTPVIIPVAMIVNYANPTVVISPMSLEETHNNPPQITTQQITVTNIGEQTLIFDAEVYINTQWQEAMIDPEAQNRLHDRMLSDGLIGDKSVDAFPGLIPGEVQYTDGPFDLQFEFACAVATGEAGVETDGNYIYTTLWNGNEICKYEMNGTFVETFECASGVRDLAWDGTYFYGAAANTTIFEMDFDAQLVVSTFNAPVATRAIAYEGDDVFWANNWSDSPTLFDRSGATLNSFSINGDESFYGFAWMDNPTGKGLWGYSQKAGTSQNMLYLYDVATGGIINEFDMMSILTIPIIGDIAGGLYMHPDIIYGSWTLGGLVQNVCLWGVEMGETDIFMNDVGVYSITEPTSGPNLTSTEPITIIIKNYGTNSQSNIPYDVTWWDSGYNGYYEDTYTGLLEYGESVEITLPVTVDMTEYTDYTFVACTYLEGDENPENDWKMKIIACYPPTYCDASTTTEDEWIANVSCGSINNSSGWQGGVADYTDLSTVIDAGMSEEITIENGNAWASDIVYAWVDWNDDFEFDTMYEVYQLTNIGGTGEFFTGTITAPMGISNGEHRMRVRMTYSTPPEPCGSAPYGEVEDYTIVSVPGDPWLTAEPLSGSLEPGESMT
ncbi:MAG: hypothetical protein B6I19_08530, partial [Bacteroidetes bacterium 4572_114]